MRSFSFGGMVDLISKCNSVLAVTAGCGLQVLCNVLGKLHKQYNNASCNQLKYVCKQNLFFFSRTQRISFIY